MKTPSLLTITVITAFGLVSCIQALEGGNPRDRRTRETQKAQEEALTTTESATAIKLSGRFTYKGRSVQKQELIFVPHNLDKKTEKSLRDLRATMRKYEDQKSEMSRISEDLKSAEKDAEQKHRSDSDLRLRYPAINDYINSIRRPYERRAERTKSDLRATREKCLEIYRSLCRLRFEDMVIVVSTNTTGSFEVTVPKEGSYYIIGLAPIKIGNSDHYIIYPLDIVAGFTAEKIELHNKENEYSF